MLASSLSLWDTARRVPGIGYCARLSRERVSGIALLGRHPPTPDLDEDPLSCLRPPSSFLRALHHSNSFHSQPMSVQFSDSGATPLPRPRQMFRALNSCPTSQNSCKRTPAPRTRPPQKEQQHLLNFCLSRRSQTSQGTFWDSRAKKREARGPAGTTRTPLPHVATASLAFLPPTRLLGVSCARSGGEEGESHLPQVSCCRSLRMVAVPKQLRSAPARSGGRVSGSHIEGSSSSEPPAKSTTAAGRCGSPVRWTPRQRPGSGCPAGRPPRTLESDYTGALLLPRPELIWGRTESRVD